MEPSDRELVGGVIRQEQEAFSLLFQRHRSVVRGHLEKILRDGSTADDLTQEVFLRLWHRAAQWNGDGALTGWLIRIATNLAFNHLRSVKRRREQPIQPVHSGEDDDVEIPAWMVDGATVAPDEAAARSERDDLLRRQVEALPEDKRVVVRMIYDAQLPPPQVADELGIPEGTVKSRLHHARQRIARAWQEMGIDWEDLA